MKQRSNYVVSLRLVCSNFLQRSLDKTGPPDSSDGGDPRANQAPAFHLLPISSPAHFQSELEPVFNLSKTTELNT